MRLQGRGLKEIRAYLNNLKLSPSSANPGSTNITGESSFSGLEHHYWVMNKWGAMCVKVHQLNGTHILGLGNPASTQGLIDIDDEYGF
jgi:hypothetical protein